jgi:putative ABC transport system permease protein
MVPVARRNLLAEKGRFAISIAGVAFAVLLVLVVLALYRGFSRTGETFELLSGELWLVQSGTTDPFHSQSLITTGSLDSAGSVPGVLAAVPVLVRQMSFSSGTRELSARLLALDALSGLSWDSSLSERYLPPRGTMLIDAILAAKEGLREGDLVRIGSLELRVGKVQPRSAEAFEPFVFINYQDAQAAFGVPGLLNFGMLVLAPSADPQHVATLIETAAPNTQVVTKHEFATAIRKEIDESFLPIIGILLAIGFTVGGAVVGLTIYTATIERSREFGVMKAVGASGAFLYRIVASQSVMLTGLGFALGLAGSLLVADAAQTLVPDFATQFRVSDIIGVMLGTVLMAFAASLVPARRLNGIDPALVFRA